jgi:hypothetical protein
MLGEGFVHGTGTSFLIDLPYHSHPQDAKQDAKYRYLLGKNLEMKTCFPLAIAQIMYGS